MNKGENRIISIDVSSSTGDLFEILDARYELYLSEKTLVLQDTGECEIEGHTISNMVSADHYGVYIIKYILTIANETVIRKIYIAVNK